MLKLESVLKKTLFFYFTLKKILKLKNKKKGKGKKKILFFSG